MSFVLNRLAGAGSGPRTHGAGNPSGSFLAHGEN